MLSFLSLFPSLKLVVLAESIHMFKKDIPFALCSSHISHYVISSMTTYFILMGFESEARGSRRSKQPSPVPVPLPIKRKARTKNNFGVSVPRARIESQETILPTAAITLSKGGQASFQPSKQDTKQRGTQAKRRKVLIPKKAQKMFNLFNKTQLLKRSSSSLERNRARPG